MDLEALRAFARRDWEAVERLDRDHWAAALRADPMATFRASQMLAEHVRLLRPDWPSCEERQMDFEHHVALKRDIDRAAGAFARR